MKKFAILISILLLGIISFGQVNPNYHYVNGYTRSNGTYVQGHYRTNPNGTNRDNYSTYPNVNPHTGKQGTIAPDNNISTSLPTSFPQIMPTSIGSNNSDILKDYEKRRIEADKKWADDESARQEYKKFRSDREKEGMEVVKMYKEKWANESIVKINTYSNEEIEKILK